ncbi:MAG TPA: NUDIX hydrolase [Bacteroidetes bacterium]|nr:NUDIX hydrolase [Bacteroidota bacterium]
MSIKPWKLLRSKFVFDGKWYRLRQDTVKLPDGREVDDYFVSIRPEVVLTFPVTTEGKAVLVRQYKHGAQKIVLEFPGGVFDPSQETAEAAALRELAEETGYTSGKMKFLGALWDDATKQNNRLHMFLVQDATHTQAQSLDEIEDIEVVEVPVSALLGMIRQGELSVSGSVSLAFMGLDALKEN